MANIGKECLLKMGNEKFNFRLPSNHHTSKNENSTHTHPPPDTTTTTINSLMFGGLAHINVGRSD